MYSPDDPMRERAPDEQAGAKARKAALIAALAEGEQSGPPVPLDFDRFLEEKRTATRA